MNTKIVNYIYVNGLLLAGGALTYALMLSNILCKMLAMYAKNIFLANALYYTKRHTPYTQKGIRDSTHNTYYLIQSAVYDTLAFQCLLSLSVERTHIYDILLFIPLSFLYEVVFDLFHYISHRCMHSSSFYKFHAVHHSTILLDPWKALYQSPVDLLLTNLAPLVLTSLLIPVSPQFLCVFMWYKSLVEMGGHSGKLTRASSFPQCIWLPRVLRIELKAQDHELHHIYPHKHFSKRFSLWDKVFGTD